LTSSHQTYILHQCHNVKLARNALRTLGAFKDEDNNLIEWRYIDKIFKLQNEIGFKLGNKRIETTNLYSQYSIPRKIN